jgi:HK97 family phage portal protein
MKIFGRKAAVGRAEARPVLVQGSSRGVIGEWPASYEAQVRDAFLANPIAQRAVRMIASSAASAPMGSDPPELLALVLARSGAQDLIETAASHLLMHGNAFIQVMTDEAGMVRELFALRPERVSVEADAQGWPAAYRYTVNGRSQRLSAGDGAARPQVIHLKQFSPLDDHLGLGCLGAAAGAVAIHNAATRWNKALLDNAARPSGALVYDPGDGATMTAAQFDRFADL